MKFCEKIGERYRNVKKRKLEINRMVNLKDISDLSERDFVVHLRDVKILKADSFEILSDLYKELGLSLSYDFFKLKEAPPNTALKAGLTQLLNISHFYLKDSDSFFETVKDSTCDDPEIIQDHHRALNCHLKGDSEGFRGFILKQINENPDDPYFDNYRFLKGIADFYKAGGRKSDWGTFKEIIESKKNESAKPLLDNALISGLEKIKINFFSYNENKTFKNNVVLAFNDLSNILPDQDQSLEIFPHFIDSLYAIKYLNSEDKLNVIVSLLAQALLNYTINFESDKIKVSEFSLYQSILSDFFNSLEKDVALQIRKSLIQEIEDVKDPQSPKEKQNAHQFTLAYVKRTAACFFDLIGDHKEAKRLYQEIGETNKNILVQDHPEDRLILENYQSFLEEYHPKNVSFNSIVRNIQIAGHFRRKAKEIRGKR